MAKIIVFSLFVFLFAILYSFEIKMVELTDGLEIYLYIYPFKGESYIRLGENLLKNKGDWKKIKDLNKLPYPMKGIPLKIPFDLLKGEVKAKILREFYKNDKYEHNGIYHLCKRETLWHLALWFTGDGKNYKRLKEANNLLSYEIEENQEIFIPKELLFNELKTYLPEKPEVLIEEKVKEEKKDEEVKISYKEMEGEILKFSEDKNFAIYKLKKGEALYSSVVVRFTGIDEVQEVINLAKEIAKLSGVEDVTKIPTNYPIKIPREYLLPKYLPLDDPKRQEWENKEKIIQETYKPVYAPELKGVYIILDAGHGGSDTGAIAGGVWESTYTYDIYNRLYNLLKEKTEAEVIPLVQDRKAKFKVIERNKLPNHRSHIILTEPPEKLSDAQRGVNLRWKLANRIYINLINRGIEKSKIVFISIHADALHPSIKGATFYIPGASYMKAITGREAIEGESQSKKLSREIAKIFLNKNISLHPYEPIREKIIRYKNSWLPAVLKMNLIPTKVLIEIVNLNNAEDRKVLETKEFRKNIAEGIFEGIVSYFQKNNNKKME